MISVRQYLIFLLTLLFLAGCQTDLNVSYNFHVSALEDINAKPNETNENAATGTNVGITAYSQDLDPQDSVTYSLTDNASGLFSIDGSTGVVTVANKLDYENASSHEIEISAYSTDGSSASRRFTVSVSDIASPPIAIITFPTQAGVFTETSINISGYIDDAEGDNLASALIATDMGTYDAAISSQNFSFNTVSFSGYGTHSYTLTTYDENGEESTANKTITLVDPKESIQVGVGTSLEKLHRIVPDTENGIYYALDEGLDALFEIDAITGDRYIISDDATGTGPLISNPTGMAVNFSTRDIYLLDESLGALLLVDAMGNRSVVSDDANGTGPVLIKPMGMALDIENNRALVVDKGTGALISIDLNTGNRTNISSNDTDAGPTIKMPGAVAIQGDFAYVTDENIKGVIGIDLLTGSRITIAALGDNNGIKLSKPKGISIDTNNNIAYIVDEVLKAVIGINLLDNSRAIVSNKNNGIGINLLQPSDIYFDKQTRQIFVTDKKQDAVILINPATGDRVILSL